MSTISSFDITFERAGSQPETCRLWTDPGHDNPRNLVANVNVSQQPPCGSWSLGKDDWQDGHLIRKEDSGRLYHALLTHYPFPGEAAPRPVHAAVKWMRGERAIEALRWEAKMYTGPLRRLQGKVVPVFYGFFSGRVENIEIGCIVLEWCPGNDWMTFGKPNDDELFLRMDAIRQLHEAGVKHGQLYDRRDSLRLLDGRHFLRAQDGTMRVVGFQKARMHECTGGLHERESLTACLDDKCRELCYAQVHWRRAVGGGLDETRWKPY
ncbi:hypothetical protein C8Q77DRAFT_1152776 [Trametes polyzona]|nr:hypothetical protein C8Q77DRAFT_1152776 [Trametes polyzona]